MDNKFPYVSYSIFCVVFCFLFRPYTSSLEGVCWNMSFFFSSTTDDTSGPDDTLSSYDKPLYVTAYGLTGTLVMS